MIGPKQHATALRFAQVAHSFLNSVIDVWKIRYRETARAEARRVAGRLGYVVGDINDIADSAWSIVAELCETGEAHHIAKGGLIKNLIGADLVTARECECAVACTCPKDEPHTVSRIVHYCARHAANNWVTVRKGPRDQTASNARRTARNKAKKLGIPPEPGVAPAKEGQNRVCSRPETWGCKEHARNRTAAGLKPLDIPAHRSNEHFKSVIQAGYKTKQRLETEIDDRDLSEPRTDGDDESLPSRYNPLSLRPGAWLSEMAASGLRPDDDLMLDSGAVTDAKRGKKLKLNAKGKAIGRAPREPITYQERVTSVLEAWRFSAPISHPTVEQWDEWMSKHPLIFATDKRSPVGDSKLESPLEWYLEDQESHRQIAGQPDNPRLSGSTPTSTDPKVLADAEKDAEREATKADQVEAEGEDAPEHEQRPQAKHTKRQIVALDAALDRSTGEHVIHCPVCHSPFVDSDFGVKEHRRRMPGCFLVSAEMPPQRWTLDFYDLMFHLKPSYRGAKKYIKKHIVEEPVLSLPCA